MLIGTMNHPGRDLFGEIEWMADAGFDFIDLTLEPPFASVSNLISSPFAMHWKSTASRCWAYRILLAALSSVRVRPASGH